MPSDYAGTDAFPAAIELPSDGDPRSAASVAAPLEALADRTAWLARRRVTLVDRLAWEDAAPLHEFTATFFDGFTNGWIDVPDCLADDVILVDLSFQTILGTTATSGEVRLSARDAWTGVETLGPITGARTTFSAYVISGSPLLLLNSAHLSASWTVADPGTTRIAIEGKIAGPPGLGTTMQILGCGSLRVARIGGIGA